MAVHEGNKVIKDGRLTRGCSDWNIMIWNFFCLFVFRSKNVPNATETNFIEAVLFFPHFGFSLQLEKRGERRAEAEKLLAQAQETGITETLHIPERRKNKTKSNLQIWDETPWCWHSSVNSFVCTAFDVSLYWSIGEQENIDKFSKRLVKVTKQHNDECKKLLTLMGVPYIEVLLLFFFPPFVQQNSNFFTVIPFDLWTYLHSSVQMLKRKALQVQYTHTHKRRGR